MTRTNSILLNLVQPLPLREPLELSTGDLSELKSAALKHNLLMLVYTRLKKHASDFDLHGSVSEFLISLDPLCLKSAAKSIQHESLENKTIGLLKGEGIPAIVIKGNALAKEIYEDINSRTSCDIDLLIRSGDVLRADEVLLQSSYARSETTPLNFRMGRLHHAVYINDETGITVEVHWNLGIPNLFDLSSEDIWAEMIFAEGSPQKLSPEMTLIMLLMHHYIHFFRELRILVDILWALDKYGDLIDPVMFGNKLRKIGLVKTMQITIDQIRYLWGGIDRDMPIIATLGRSLEKISNRRSGLLMSYFRMDLESDRLHDQFMDKIIARFALDRRRTVAYSFTKIFLPQPKTVRDFYGDNRNWILPFSYIRFFVWRIKEWGRK